MQLQLLGHQPSGTKRLLSMVDDYLLKLYDDIDRRFKDIKALGLTVITVYVGGGTPTVLDEKQMTALLSKITSYVDPSTLLEFTYEAGRPDTVTEWIEKRLIDVANLAADDIAPATLSFTKAEVKDVSFVRRFRLKDGTVTTNPGWQNPEIDCPLGEGDNGASLLIIKRENKEEIGIVHFQVHPDVITGTKYSADFPKFVRDTVVDY